MARNRKKNYNTPDAFIAQNLIEIEKPKTNIRAIVIIIAVIIIIIGGGGLYLFYNRADFEWELRLPWQTEEDEPIFSIKTKKSIERKELEEFIIPEFNTGVISRHSKYKLELFTSDLKHDSKGYTFKLNIKAEHSINFRMDKILLDRFPIDCDFKLENKKGEIEATLRINQTELDRFNMKSFSYMVLYYEIEDLEENVKGYEVHVPKLFNGINYDNSITGIIPIYENDEDKLYFYKIETDKDNTYIYFYFENSNDSTSKEISIKKLLINDKLYDYQTFKYDIYCYAKDIFYLTIPKNKIRDVENFNVSFFITYQYEDSRLNPTYITNEYSKKI